MTIISNRYKATILYFHHSLNLHFFSSIAIHSNDALPFDVEFFDDSSLIPRKNNILHQDLTFLDNITNSSESNDCIPKQLHQNSFIPVQSISPNITDCNDVLPHEAEFLNHSPSAVFLHMSNAASKDLTFMDNATNSSESSDYFAKLFNPFL